MTQTSAAALLDLPIGMGQMMTVPAGRVMLFDNIDLHQSVYGQVRKVEVVEVGSRIRTRITVSDGREWTCDSRTAVRITRVC